MLCVHILFSGIMKTDPTAAAQHCTSVFVNFTYLTPMMVSFGVLKHKMAAGMELEANESGNSTWRQIWGLWQVQRKVAASGCGTEP